MAYTSFSVAQSEVPNAAKWNTLGSNDAWFYGFLGDNVEWQSWTPTWTSITKGNATVTAYYTRVGNTVFGRVNFVVGSSTVMTGAPIFTFPVTAHADFTSVQHVIGAGLLVDVGASIYSCTIRNQNTTSASIILMGAVATYVDNQGISSTVPFTWVTGDYFGLTFMYEAA